MRLTDFERRTIREAVARHFGPQTRVRLFGSRVDDRKRGGDIDLYVDGIDLSTDQAVERRMALWADLQDRLGEQKIDIVVRRPDSPRLLIHEVAEREGVDIVLDTNDSLAKVDAVLATCTIHRQRLEDSLARLGDRWPRTVEAVRAMTGDDRDRVESTLSRFAKLQDLMGAKLFPLLVELSQEPAAARMTFIDTLNLLEKVGAIPSTQGWHILRSVRNALAHDYPDDETATAVGLTKVMAALPGLFAFDDAVRAYVDRFRAGPGGSA